MNYLRNEILVRFVDDGIYKGHKMPPRDKPRGYKG